MPTIQSSDIWRTSNRYDTYGKEMLRIIDRNNKDLVYGPTNEEMITAIGKQYIKSYKNLPRKFFPYSNKLEMRSDQDLCDESKRVFNERCIQL